MKSLTKSRVVLIVTLAAMSVGCKADQYILPIGCGPKWRDCSVADLSGYGAGKATEIETGFGVNGHLGTQYRSTNLNLFFDHAQLGYDGGYDNVYRLGVDARYRLDSTPTMSSFWIGGEFAYAPITSVDYVGPLSYSKGFTIGAIGGYAIPYKQFEFGPTVGLAYYQVGDGLTDDGEVYWEGGSSFFFRLGAEARFYFWR